jgi:acyl-CoA reductase-like NAD-dependent aldehyde dehydrogenase
MQGMSESSSTSRQMAEKTQQIQADLDNAMKTANMTTEKLRMRTPDDEINQLHDIVLLLQQEIGELRRMAR